MGLSRWGDRVDQKLSASKGLSPGEHITQVALKIERESTAKALMDYVSPRLPLATVKCYMDPSSDVYVLQISIIVKEQPFIARRRISDAELNAATTTKIQYEAFMKKTVRDLVEDIRTNVRDGIGVSLGPSLRPQDGSGWANMTNVTAANMSASVAQAAQAMSRLSFHHTGNVPSPEDDARAEAAARASIEETVRNLKKK